MKADRTWEALLEVTRTLVPEKRQSSKPAERGASRWLYLGAYYFGGESGVTPYETFCKKIGMLVRHIGQITGSKNVIDTF